MAGGSGMQRSRDGGSNEDRPSNNNSGGGDSGHGRFDGPGDSRSGSPSKQPQRPNPFPQGIGYDPAKPAPKPESMITNTRVEMPMSAYMFASGLPMTDLPARPGLNTAGKAIAVRVNQFKVTQIPNRDIYQYDIMIGDGAEKRGKVMAVWHSKAVQNKLIALVQNKGPWLWDGNKLAWSAFGLPEQRILVDLDAEKGRQPRPDRKPDTAYCLIRPAKKIPMAVIAAFLNKQMTMDKTIIESISFLDHLMRQYPSAHYTCQKRSYFAQGGDRRPLDNVIEAMRGVYTSIRLCDPKPSMGGPGTGLAVNVDVANGTFWASQDVHQAARNFCREGNRNLDYRVFRDILLPVKDPKKNGVYTFSESFKNLRKMAKLKFTVKHRGKQDDKKEYVIAGFSFNRDAKYAREGLHAKNYTFALKSRQTNAIETISVYDYFVRQYNVRLEFWFLPLVETSRAGFFPMELCTLSSNQKYQYKLSPDQTANMIKFAVTRPKERLAAIQHGVGMLKWQQDVNLQHFGMKIDPNLTVTQARLLQPPEVHYSAGGKANPGTSGRWDLRGKKFLVPNPTPLKSWGFCVLNKCTNEQTVRNFASVFCQTYIGHGGKIINRNPVVHIMDGNTDLADGVVAIRKMTGDFFQVNPQIIFFVLPGRDSFMYERLKKNMECRFAMMSQMVNVAHVQKAQPQYCSNVCMKVNAKLGGTTCKVPAGPKPFFGRPTMILGADVSHPSPGSKQPSMAALTMSMDKDACRYAAAVQTNGFRVEMIEKANIETMLIPLFRKWIIKVGNNKGPEHIYYFRDGVSEGQYQHVLQQEVADMKSCVAEAFGPQASTIRWTVTICSKRHHIRIFPKEGDSAAADRNNNPLPGTLVERDVTHPFEYDFYLNSHAAIQGTARPVHYHVILDEAKVPVNDFQRLVYQHCYQYMRSTTPVSLFPAVYYAHLASNRARCHESRPASDGARGGQKFEERRQDQAVERARRGESAPTKTGSSAEEEEVLPLLPLGDAKKNTADVIENIRLGMWYI